jgi:predicted nucleic acid-binding protein
VTTAIDTNVLLDVLLPNPAFYESDFIGAHARFHADLLLTRDRGFYKEFFPSLRILDPSAD